MPNDEAAIEAEIQAKGKTAPRLTPGEIEATITSETYQVFPGTTLTVCMLVLRNGFSVTGESAAASPENFDAEIGRKIARENARQKIWMLEGYLLRQRLWEKSVSSVGRVAASGTISLRSDAFALPPHLQRVQVEQAELLERIVKLRSFLGSHAFKRLHVAEQNRLKRQYQTMTLYADILQDRLEARGGDYMERERAFATNAGG